MLCLPRLPSHSEDTQYLPRTNLWGQWTIKSNHSHFTSTITGQRSSPAFLHFPLLLAEIESKIEVLSLMRT